MVIGMLPMAILAELVPTIFSLVHGRELENANQAAVVCTALRATWWVPRSPLGARETDMHSCASVESPCLDRRSNKTNAANNEDAHCDSLLGPRW
jgi:hypothetical protein